MQNLVSEIDHVAIAVPDRNPAIFRFVNEMGAGVVASGRRSGSTIDQLKFRNGNKLEILGPDLQHKLGNRMIDFLEKHGSTIHHVTLNVQSVATAVQILEDHGIKAVGVSVSDKHYQEAYVSPKDTGGILVQLSWKDVDDEGWAKRHGHVPTVHSVNASEFIGLRVVVDEPDLSANCWAVFGARIDTNKSSYTANWGNGSLSIEFTRGQSVGEQILLFGGSEHYERSVEYGPQVCGILGGGS
jgi:hypothetical protein